MSAVTCVCPTCERRFVVVDSAPTADARCSCGAALTASQLEQGVYELKRPRRVPKAAKSPNTSHAKMPVEPDLGYGESHGYGPAHGGPTGPGDAPAPEVAEEPLPAATDAG